MRRLHTFLATLLLFSGVSTQADVLVLVHGYLASPTSWEASGINNILDHNGWKRGGVFTRSPLGPQLLETDAKSADNTVYVVDLPADAPVLVQSDHLMGMLNTIRQRQPNEPLILVGHSAGGVVARMTLVRGGGTNVHALVTIASPHVGTTRAEQALDITDESGPFGRVKKVLGGDVYDVLRHSRGLLYDLTRPHPGNLLFWLNSQPHPDIQYVSVVRLNPVGFAGDELVPGFSQDMNNVPALHGNSSVITTPAGHTLVPQDANTIIDVLQQIDVSKTASL